MADNDTVPTPQTGKVDAGTKPNDPKEASQGAKHFQAAPGPAIPQNMPEQEGSKEERLAKAQAFNK